MAIILPCSLIALPGRGLNGSMERTEAQHDRERHEGARFFPGRRGGGTLDARRLVRRSGDACSFRDNYGEFAKRGIRVVGVSPDSPAAHAAKILEGL